MTSSPRIATIVFDKIYKCEGKGERPRRNPRHQTGRHCFRDRGQNTWASCRDSADPNEKSHYHLYRYSSPFMCVRGRGASDGVFRVERQRELARNENPLRVDEGRFSSETRELSTTARKRVCASGESELKVGHAVSGASRFTERAGNWRAVATQPTRLPEIIPGRNFDFLSSIKSVFGSTNVLPEKTSYQAFDQAQKGPHFRFHFCARAAWKTPKRADIFRNKFR